MKLLACSAFLIFFPAVKPVPAIDTERLIAVLCEVEQGRWGSPGGAANMSYYAWEQHSRLAYQLSASREHALPVYREHLKTLRQQILDQHKEPTVVALSTAWLLGFDGALRQRLASDYGTRCLNLYSDKTFTKPIP